MCRDETGTSDARFAEYLNEMYNHILCGIPYAFCVQFLNEEVGMRGFSLPAQFCAEPCATSTSCARLLALILVGKKFLKFRIYRSAWKLSN